MQPNKTELEQIREIGLRLLTRREHSRDELVRKIQAKGFEVALVQQVVDELSAQGWQSDDRFAESFIRSRISNGYGPLRINYELQQHRIDCQQLERLVAETTGSWMQLIERVYSGKFSQVHSMSYKEWTKRARFLQQRGFSFEMIRALFDQLQIKLN